MRTVLDRTTGGSSFPWLLITVTALVLGLLGMHTLHNADPIGHASAISSSQQSLPLTLSIDADTGSMGLPDTAAVHTAASPVSEGHDDLSFACMLALLLTFVALIRPLRGATIRSSARAAFSPFAARILRTPAQGPSLLQLSISRT